MRVGIYPTRRLSDRCSRAGTVNEMSKRTTSERDILCTCREENLLASWAMDGARGGRSDGLALRDGQRGSWSHEITVKVSDF